MTTEEATEFAKKKNIAYFETSAKKNINIEDGFSKIANDIFKKHINKVEKAITLDSKRKSQDEKSCCGGKNKKTDKKENKNVESKEKEKK